MTQVAPPIAVTLQEAVALTGISKDKLMQAIHATTGPRIKAKRNGNRYSLKYSDLIEFWDSLPDA